MLKHLTNPRIYLLPLALGLLGLFLFSIVLTSDAIVQLYNPFDSPILSLVNSPIASFCIGMLFTTLLQRSSTVTSIAVVTFSTGVIDLQTATLIIFGANLGTTITSDLVALSHIFQRKKFKDAFGAATVHDAFNLLTVLVLVPLELIFGLVSNTASAIVETFDLGFGTFALNLNIKEFLSSWSHELLLYMQPIYVLGLGIILIITSMILLKTLSQRALKNKGGKFFERVFGGENQYQSLGYGLMSTAVLQSSSLTTSMSVLFAGSQKISVRNVFPFILGANLGTTITAFLAALTLSSAAISVAIVHLLFNFFGFLIFFPFPLLRRLPVLMAEKFAAYCAEKRYVAFAYLLFFFVLIPTGFLYFSQLGERINHHAKVIKKEPKKDLEAYKP